MKVEGLDLGRPRSNRSREKVLLYFIPEHRISWGHHNGIVRDTAWFDAFLARERMVPLGDEAVSVTVELLE